jgi:Mn-dependent DtxR family transcriptional regulator
VKFNIKQDLKNRRVAQQAEILCISGPYAERLMKLLADEDLEKFKKVTGLTLTPATAAAIVNKYGYLILTTKVAS